MSKQSDIVKVSQDAGTTGFVNTTGDTMTGALGIGTAPATSPSTMLHVREDDSVDYIARISVQSTDQMLVAGSKWQGGVEQYSFIKSTNAAETVGQSMRLQIGDNTALGIDISGRVTMPYQPMFSAYNLSTGSQYVITVNTWATFDSNLTNFSSPRYVVDTNIGSHYSATNGRFTAPITGRYLVSFNVAMWVATTTYVSIFKNGAPRSPYQISYNADLGGYQGMTLVQVMTLSAGDYVEPGFYSTSGTYDSFVPGGGYFNFSGYLIG